MTLDDVRADAFRRLSAGVVDRQSPFRNPALATIDATGAPSIRTVVLRGFDPDAFALCIHTDLRAAKVEQIRTEPRVSLHVWDDTEQVQVRISGRAYLHSGDRRAHAEWDRLHPGSRATYTTEQMPGAPIEERAEVSQVSEDTGFQQFAVIDVTMLSLEWLQLAPGGQCRARLMFGPMPGATWLVP